MQLRPRNNEVDKWIEMEFSLLECRAALVMGGNIVLLNAEQYVFLKFIYLRELQDLTLLDISFHFVLTIKDLGIWVPD